MNKFAAGVVLGLILSCGLGLAAQGVDHNGAFWNGLGSSAKQGYVSGYSDAMNVSVGKLDQLTVAADLFRWKGAKKIIRQLSRELAIADQNPEDVVKRLNDLYADRKYGKLDLGSAVQLLTMRAQAPEAAQGAATAPGAAAPPAPASAAPGASGH
jgi:hypothetical protein